jgi:hypothetical protein
MGEPTISSKAYVQSAPFLHFSIFVTISFSLVFSLEEALLKVLPFPPLNSLETARAARTEFYDKFQCEADERDHNFLRKYVEDLNTIVVFVRILFLIRLDRGVDLFFWANRPVYSLQSHPLSLLTFRAISNRTSNK